MAVVISRNSIDAALVRLGPGGDFVSDYVPDESGRLARRAEAGAPADGDPQQQAGGGVWSWFSRGGASGRRGGAPGSSASAVRASDPSTDRATDQVELSELALRAGTLLAAQRVLEQQGRALLGVLQAARSLVAPSRSGGLSAGTVSAIVEPGLVGSLSRRPSPAAVPTGSVFDPSHGTATPVLGSSSFAPSSPITLSPSSPGPQTGPNAGLFQSESRAEPKECVHEPHAEATANSPADPRLPRAAWLFADDAGARRRDRRQQGHGVRARRSADQEGRADARSEQGSLFVDR